MLRGMKLAAAALAAALVLAACGEEGEPGGSTETGGQEPEAAADLQIGLAYDIGGRGDQSFNDAAAAGLDGAVEELGLDEDAVRELEAGEGETAADKSERLRLLAEAGFNPVIAVGFVYSQPLAEIAPDFPDTRFAIVDDAAATADNIANLVFAEEEGSFLVGAAAALKSETGTIGFVGGCTVPLISKFQAGFEAGVAAVDPGAQVRTTYLSDPPGCEGFNDPAAGRTAAEGLYDGGSDVVFQVAGGSGGGVFEAADAADAWAIGVDSDQYETAGEAVQDHILTSMLKRVDVAVNEFITSVAADEFEPGPRVFDLAADGVGYSTSGGFVEDIAPQLEEFKQQIIDGEIEVPTEPAG